jgi:hypothetical protein
VGVVGAALAWKLSIADEQARREPTQDRLAA